jgi:predicted MFS family arabinose efflux permease
MLFATHALWLLAALMFVWGALNAATPVGWFNWLAREVRDEPEAGGGLMVAAIQLAIMLGAGLGGLLLDHLSITATLLGSASLLAIAGSLVGNGQRLGAKIPERHRQSEMSIVPLGEH